MKLNGRSIGWTATAAVLTVLAWYVAGRLSSDALGMGVGIVFGMLAMIPAVVIAFSAGKDAANDGEIDTPEYRAAGREQMVFADGFRAGEEHAQWRIGMRDPDYMPARQSPAVVPVQETHYHYHAAQGQQQQQQYSGGIVVQNGVPGKIRVKANGCSFQPLDERSGQHR